MDLGLMPVARSGVDVKVPSPLPRRTVMVLAYAFTTARSGMPSPLKSPVTTDCGPVPTAIGGCKGFRLKDGVPLLSVALPRVTVLLVSINDTLPVGATAPLPVTVPVKV